MKRLAIVSMLGLSLFMSGCIFGNSESPANSVQASSDGEVHETYRSLDGVVLQTMDGKPFSFAELKGKPIYIKVWATWCPTCVRGMPKLEELVAEKDRGYQIVTVVLPGIFKEKSPEAFRQWYSMQPYNEVPVVFDTEGKLIHRYNLHAMPTSIFVNKDLKVLRVVPGQLSNEAINEWFQKLESK